MSVLRTKRSAAATGASRSKEKEGGVVRVPAVRQGSKERIENRVIRPNNKKKVMKDHGN